MLSGKQIKLVTYCDDYFNIVYKWYINSKYKDVIIDKNTILSREDYYSYLINNNFNISLFIVPLTTDTPIGCIYSYNYNSFDNYSYIKIYMNEDNFEYYKETMDLFLNYLFTYFPLRKIYYEEYDYNKEQIKYLKEYDFKLECCLEEYKYLNGNYYNKYIFSLFRNKFYKEVNKSE